MRGSPTKIGDTYFSQTSEYSSWQHMKKRCLSPSYSYHASYGGRGIEVCERWLGKDGFRNFLEDMGRKPSSLHSIERIDNDGNYEPSNCKWATKTEQCLNQRLRKDNKSGAKGVSWHKRVNKWYVSFRVARKKKSFGYFENLEDAIRVAAKARNL